MPTFDPPPIPLARKGEQFYVARPGYPYSSKAGNTYLPNILCLAIERKIGPQPSIARFRYRFDPLLLGPGFPSRVEDVIGLNVGGPYVVSVDDMLVVLRDDGDGTPTPIWTGYAQVPQADISKQEFVTFEGLGLELREFDLPLSGAFLRQGPDPSVLLDVPTGLPARFNPDGNPNKTADTLDSSNAGRSYPAFWDAEQDPDQRAYWTLDSACRYVLFHGGYTGVFLVFQDYSSLTHLLEARTPLPGADTMDANKPATYVTGPILVHDLDVSGEAWPDAIHKIVSPHNFDVFWSEDVQVGTRTTYGASKLNFLRYDGGDALAPKQVYLQAPGVQFDPAQSNVNGMSISRDSSQVRNAVTLDTDPVHYEIGAVLAPAFTPDATDVNNLLTFAVGNVAFTGDNVDKYRNYILSEGGDSWWSFTLGTLRTTATSMIDVFGQPTPGVNGAPPIPKYATRRRKPISKLISRNAGKDQFAQLWASQNYAGRSPGIWDGTGDWQQLTQGQWQLMKDRIGIRITSPKINDMTFGVPTNTTLPASPKMGAVNLPKCIAAPDAMNPRITFMLLCTVKGDQDLDATAPRRSASPTQFTITRRIATRDRFKKGVLAASSKFNTLTPRKEIVLVDDTDDAMDYAVGMRGVTECPVYAGKVTIPKWTSAYKIGDRISMVAGRGISFRTTAAAEQGEAARYPVVVGIQWNFDGQQSTTLQLADLRAMPAAERST